MTHHPYLQPIKMCFRNPLLLQIQQFVFNFNCYRVIVIMSYQKKVILPSYGTTPYGHQTLIFSSNRSLTHCNLSFHMFFRPKYEDSEGGISSFLDKKKTIFNQKTQYKSTSSDQYRLNPNHDFNNRLNEMTIKPLLLFLLCFNEFVLQL